MHRSLERLRLPLRDTLECDALRSVGLGIVEAGYELAANTVPPLTSHQSSHAMHCSIGMSGLYGCSQRQYTGT